VQQLTPQRQTSSTTNFDQYGMAHCTISLTAAAARLWPTHGVQNCETLSRTWPYTITDLAINYHVLGHTLTCFKRSGHRYQLPVQKDQAHCQAATTTTTSSSMVQLCSCAAAAAATGPGAASQPAAGLAGVTRAWLAQCTAGGGGETALAGGTCQ
jgi:hypothetical protein